jgi:hypothetical protein
MRVKSVQRTQNLLRIQHPVLLPWHTALHAQQVATSTAQEHTRLKRGGACVPNTPTPFSCVKLSAGAHNVNLPPNSMASSHFQSTFGT